MIPNRVQPFLTALEKMEAESSEKDAKNAKRSSKKVEREKKSWTKTRPDPHSRTSLSPTAQGKSETLYELDMAPKTTKAASNPRKRRQSDQAAPTSSSTKNSVPLLPPTASLGKLDFGSDAEDDGDVLERDSDEGDDGPEDAFPEVDLQDSDPEDDSFDGSADEEDFEDEDEDEEALLRELEAEEDEDVLSQSSEDDPSDLDELIRRNTSKPTEDEAPTPFTGLEALEQEGVMRDYMKRSRVVKSDVTGKDKTVWDEEIDAEYASDSSTEEVSRFSE